MYHNCIPLIVPRFSFFVEDLVVGCNDITELDRVGLDPWESGKLLVFLKDEDPDEVTLEDLCCHFQRMLILVPPNSP